MAESAVVAGIAQAFKIVDITGCGFIIRKYMILHQKQSTRFEYPTAFPDKTSTIWKMMGRNPARDQIAIPMYTAKVIPTIIQVQVNISIGFSFDVLLGCL